MKKKTELEGEHINRLIVTTRTGVEIETTELEHHRGISTKQEPMQRLCSRLVYSHTRRAESKKFSMALDL